MAEAHVIPVMASAAPASAEPWPSPARAWYAVVIFGFTILTLFGNQWIIALLIEPMKHDLNLTDKQISLVVGVIGSLVLAAASLPVSKLADTYSRRVIIGIGLLILGICSALSGLATTAVQLLIIRLVGGVGGAGNGSATFSMLGDLFPPTKLPKAMATMNIGFMVALGLSYILGGTLIFALQKVPILSLPLLGELHPWQVVFLILAVPDLLLGLLMLFTVHEPKRRGRAMHGDAAARRVKAATFAQIRDYMSTNAAAFWPMYVGLAFNCLALGTSFWMAPFYSRTYGWGPDKFGIIQGCVLLVLAPAGLWFGGWLAEQLARRGRADANLRVVFIATLAHIPFAVFFGLMPSPWLALAMASLNTCVIGIGTGPQNAAFQAIVPNEMRGQVTASFLFVFTVAAAIGPYLVGWMTTDWLGENNLRYALVIMHAILGPLAALSFWKGLKAYGAAVLRTRAVLQV
jgi:MFS family permease